MSAPPTYEKAVYGFNTGPVEPTAPSQGMDNIGFTGYSGTNQIQPSYVTPPQPGVYSLNLANYGMGQAATQPTKQAPRSRACTYVRRGFGIFFNLAVIGCVIAVIVLVITEKRLAALIVGCVGLGLLVGILVEACCSNTMEYLKNFHQLKSLRDYVDRVKAAAPVLEMHIKCYHNETRFRTVSQTDGNGNTTYRTETYTVEVVTHRETEAFNYRQWRDVSEDIMVIDSNKPTRVRCTASYRFQDERTSQAFTNQYESLKDRNRNRDKYMDDKISFEVPHFKEHVTAYWEERSVSCWFSRACFCLSSLLLCTYCYRYCFRARTSKTNFNCIKEIGL